MTERKYNTVRKNKNGYPVTIFRLYLFVHFCVLFQMQLFCVLK